METEKKHHNSTMVKSKIKNRGIFKVKSREKTWQYRKNWSPNRKLFIIALYQYPRKKCLCWKNICQEYTFQIYCNR